MVEPPAAATPLREQVIVQVCADIEGGVMDYLRHFDCGIQSKGAQARMLLVPTPRPKHHCLSAELAELLDQSSGRPATVVVHFSGYGLARWGLCFWVVRQLRQLRRVARQNYRLLIIFHEVFASGPPWSTAFWASPAQRWIAGQLVRAADCAWTTTERHGAWLRRKAGSEQRVAVYPVFSTVGESEDVRPWGERRRRLVVFGSEPTRKRAFMNAPRLDGVLRHLAIEEVVEIGSGQSCGERVSGIPCRFAGRLADPELRQVLSDSSFGLIDYPSDYLAKSSVFAAYAAHGCLTVNSSDVIRRADGLDHGAHYLGWSDPGPYGDEHLATIAGAAASWYRQHAFARQLDDLLRLAAGEFRREAAAVVRLGAPLELS